MPGVTDLPSHVLAMGLIQQHLTCLSFGICVVGGGGSRTLLLGGHAWTHPIGAIRRPGARADRMPGQNQWPQWMLEIPISGRSNFPASLRNVSPLHSRHVQGTLGFQFTHFLFKRSLKTSPLAQKVFYAFTLCSQSLSLCGRLKKCSLFK